MEIIRNRNNNDITIKKDDQVVSMLYFVPSYFIWEFTVDDSFNNFIILTKEDGVFYDNIAWLMGESYTFPHPYSSKTENRLIWLSEHCYDIEDEFQRNITPRLIIERVNDKFAIYYHLPKANNKNNVMISFAPAGNGYLSRNNDTGITFQDDMINVFYHTLKNEIITPRKSKTKTRKKDDFN